MPCSDWGIRASRLASVLPPHSGLARNSGPAWGVKEAGRFSDAWDYVGLDFFPDVFRPVAPDGEKGDVRDSVIAVLGAMRRQWLAAAGIDSHVPIHVTENDWPTGPTRPPERQSQVLETVIRTIYEARERLGIERYMMFDLRDTDSLKLEVEGDFFYHFGLTHDDYSPKMRTRPFGV